MTRVFELVTGDCTFWVDGVAGLERESGCAIRFRVKDTDHPIHDEKEEHIARNQNNEWTEYGEWFH